jgi:leucyl aminopeptidase
MRAKGSSTPSAVEAIASRIVMLRGERVLPDVDLATLYCVTTKALNQAVKRNAERFPEDFAFQLTATEAVNLKSQLATASSQHTDSQVDPRNRSQIVTSSQKHRDPRFRPWVFTEYGALMAANVLRSKRAVQMSVTVVRAFVRLREMIASHKVLARRLDELEARYDTQFKVVFDAIRELMVPPEPPRKRRIGFVSGD